MGLAIISILILVVVVIIAVPILARIFGEAASRNPNRPGGEGDETEGDRGGPSGPGRE